jgi:site-specific recombinase XerD
MDAPNLTPEQAVEDFLKEREGEVSKASHRNYKYALEELIRFCEDQEIEYINEIHAYNLKQYKIRRRKSGIKEVTLKNNLSTLRVFLRWCAQAGLIEGGMAEMVQLPSLSSEQRSNDEILTLDEVEDILDYFYKYEYAQRRHTIFQLMWHTCLRMGTIIALDINDYNRDKRLIEVRHRPDKGTPLKNGNEAERIVNLDNQMAEVLNDYIRGHRKHRTDDHGRKPLFTTPYGRITHTTIRKNVYAMTRPCVYHNTCPHNRRIEDCEAAQKKTQSSKCPSSKSAHPVRRAAITYHLNRNWPKEKISERANVSIDVLDEHYDGRSEGERAMTRKQYLDNL